MNSKAYLIKGLGCFLVAMDYYPSDCMGAPDCPLCHDTASDYRALSDEEIAEAWRVAATEYNRIWGGLTFDYDPAAPCWSEIHCQEDWRELKTSRMPEAP